MQLGVNIFLFWFYVCFAGLSRSCPGYDNVDHGTLVVDDRDEYNCLLTCNDGYQATGCDDSDTTNGTCIINNCHTDFLKEVGYNALAFAVGFAAVFVIPCVILLIGFGVGGVIKGSCAACIQTPDTESGSCFACCQSCGTRLTKKCVLITGLFGGVLGVVLYCVGKYVIFVCKPSEPKCEP